MYIKRSSKYLVYLYVVDIISVLLSAVAAYLIRFWGELQFVHDYMSLFLVVVLAMFCVCAMTRNFSGFFERGAFNELKAVGKQYTFIIAIALLFLLAEQKTVIYSRLVVFGFFAGGMVLTYTLRLVFKTFIMSRYRATVNGSKAMIVCTSECIDDILVSVQNKTFWDYSFTSIAVIDEDRIGDTIGGLQVIANLDNLFEVARTQVLDEVLVHLGYRHPSVHEVIDGFSQMGTTVHLVMSDIGKQMVNPKIEFFGGFQVITSCDNEITHFKLFQKRLLDVAGGLFGMLITIVAGIVIVPAIKLGSRGPAIYTQTRIGRNGRPFKIYKFRSMISDADARKQELLEKNQMQGHMFKLDDDPRITKIGRFLRKTSLDEFPQFLNVLKGEMSLVGTRPPTVDEFRQYSPHHKSRLSFKPGITGLWQVSGRSLITDFEQIVELDSTYIRTWSMRLDIQIICKTVLSVVRHKGAK
ncbi:MAG: sugar transferase [Oscillospiraceae bacterium]